MRPGEPTPSEMPTSAWNELGAVVERFEEAWRKGQRPTISEYLPADEQARRAALVELVHVEMECRLKRGEAVRAEEYLGAYPELARDADAALSLVQAEFRLRQAVEGAVAAEEYAERFPQLRSEITQRLATLDWPPAARVRGASTLAGVHTTPPPPADGPPSAGPPAGREPRYLPLHVHARGGLGEVLVAQDVELNRRVALKRIQERFRHDVESRRRFLLEAEVTGRLEHPGVVPIYGLVRDAAGQPCYAMRLIEGETLHEAIRRFHDADPADRAGGRRNLVLRQLLTRFVAVCDTVAYAHSRGVLHRDLKPLNVMLGKYGETLVVDWGLTKAVGKEESPEDSVTPLVPSRPSTPDATEYGRAVGTPAFMSPEQAAGRWDELGPTSDVYGLGATLYTILAGKPPFSGGEEVLPDVCAGRFPAPRQVAAGIDPALEAVCVKAMAREPSDRYASARALADDVERWLADEPVSAYAEPWRRKAARWARRHRPAVAAGIVAVLLLVAGGVAGLLASQAADRRRHEYLTNLASYAAAQDDLARSEIHAGRLEVAEKILRQATERLAGEPSLAELRERLAARLGRTQRLVRFYHQTDEGERLVSGQNVVEIYENQQADREAVRLCEEGLRALGVFDHEADWWEHLPEPDLTDEQRTDLREEAYRQLVLLGAVHAKAGVMSYGTPRAAPALREGLEVLRLARNYRAESYSGARIELFCLYGLGKLSKGSPAPPREPVTATDYYVAGVLHCWIAMAPDDPIATWLKRQVRDLIGMDLETPLATSQRCLRKAVALAPRNYWGYMWLAHALHLAGRPDDAELAIDNCIVLRPEYPTGYMIRSQLLFHEAEDDPSPARKQALLKRALADTERALPKAKDNIVLLEARGRLRLELGKGEQAMEDFNEVLRLKPDKPVSYQGAGAGLRPARPVPGGLRRPGPGRPAGSEVRRRLPGPRHPARAPGRVE